MNDKSEVGVGKTCLDPERKRGGIDGELYGVGSVLFGVDDVLFGVDSMLFGLGVCYVRPRWRVVWRKWPLCCLA